MNTAVKIDSFTAAPLLVPHIIKGKVLESAGVVHNSRDMDTRFATPVLSLNELVWQRSEQPPAANVPMSEIIDLLVELGKRLTLDSNPYLLEALERMEKVSTLGPRILRNCYEDLGRIFERDKMEAEALQSYGNIEVIDGWLTTNHIGTPARLRAYPSRMVHMLAGNAPTVSALSVMRGALSKSVSLLKMASNDLFTPVAILRTLTDIDATHPVTRSFSCVYWKGGDLATESALLRAQYFDKLVAWGGESAIRHALKYVGPGFELIAFDPKVSASMVGNEVFASEAATSDAARRAAADVLIFNQDACASSRHVFVEGSTEQANQFSKLLAEAMGHDVRYGDGVGPKPPANVREAVEMLRHLDPIYSVYGGYDGRGLVVRSEHEPVDFHPDGKTVNVIQVDKLEDALRYITVATQTIGVLPSARKTKLRDALSSAGVQRIVTLGEVHSKDAFGGRPHDATFPLHRYVRWISEEGPTS